jgi:hypothetical protein
MTEDVAISYLRHSRENENLERSEILDRVEDDIIRLLHCVRNDSLNKLISEVLLIDHESLHLLPGSPH